MKTIFGKRLGDFTQKYSIAGMLIQNLDQLHLYFIIRSNHLITSHDNKCYAIAFCIIEEICFIYL